MNREVGSKLDEAADELKQVLPEWARLARTGNLPGLKDSLLAHYERIRTVVEHVPSHRELMLEAEQLQHVLDTETERSKARLAQAEADLREFQADNPLYTYLRECETFYKTWCGSRGIGAPCGMPSALERNVWAAHERVDQLWKQLPRDH